MAIWGNIYNPISIKLAKRAAKKKARAVKRQAAKEKQPKAPAAKPQPKFQEAPPYRPGMGKEFYLTREWRTLRYGVFVRYGKVCQCCGQTQGYMHVDHIKPRSRYPELELVAQNLQVLCEACNIGKSNTDMTDWRPQGLGVAVAPSTA